MDAMADVPFEVFLGVDVGKSEHYGCALDRCGQVLWEGRPTNDESAVIEVLDRLGRQGPVLVVADQLAAIGALVVRVAAGRGIPVGYLPGLSMRRIADLHPGQAKTDRLDAWVIADAGRSLPHTIKRVDPDAPGLSAEITVLAGYDEDLRGQVNQDSNRLHDALTHVHPALERVVGKHLQRLGVLAVLAQAPTPAALQVLGADGIAAAMALGGSPRSAKTLPAAIIAALGRQSVVIPGTEAFGTVIAGTATRLAGELRERQLLEQRPATLLEAHPLGKVLTSMPAVGVRTAAGVLAAVPDISTFPSADRFVAFAGLNPVTRQSGTSIRGERPNRGGHRQLRNVLWRSADIARLTHPDSRAFHDRKRTEGKTHAAAMPAARPRARVIYTLMRDQAIYNKPAAAA